MLIGIPCLALSCLFPLKKRSDAVVELPGGCTPVCFGQQVCKGTDSSHV